MRGSQEKLVLAVLAVYLLVGALTATSSMIPHGNNISIYHLLKIRYVVRTMMVLLYIWLCYVRKVSNSKFIDQTFMLC